MPNTYVVKSDTHRREIESDHPYLAAKQFVKEECIEKDDFVLNEPKLPSPESLIEMTKEEIEEYSNKISLSFGPTISVTLLENEDYLSNQFECLKKEGREEFKKNMDKRLNEILTKTYKYSSSAIMQELGFFADYSLATPPPDHL